MARLSGVDLRKWYGQREVVRGVSPEVNQGEIVGLLGPNGAGKTTSFYMLTGIIKPSSGRVLLEDFLPPAGKFRLQKTYGASKSSDYSGAYGPSP